MSTKNGSTHVRRAAVTNGRTARLRCLALLSMVFLIAGHAAHGVARAPAAKESRSLGRKNVRARSVSVKAFVLPGSEAAQRSPGPGTLSTGFEPGEGFAPGFIGGQAGWFSILNGGSAEGHIDTVNPHPSAGVQHLRISNDPALATGTITGAISPDLGPLPTGASTTSVEVAISGTGGADYLVGGQSSSQGALTWEVDFRFLGTILVADDIGAGLVFVDTGATWTVGPYRNLTVCDDPVAGTTDYFYDRVLIYTQVTHLPGTRVEQVFFLSNNFHVNDDGDFDNLSIQSGLSGPCGTTVILDPAVNFAVGDNPFAVAVGDFDADGDQDLAVANSSDNSVTILRNTGNGTYQLVATLNTGQNAADIIALDLDADGDLDLAVAAGNLVTFLNDGTGTFLPGLITGVGCCPTSLAFGDFNNDCALDIAVTNLNPPSNDVAIVLNNGDWTAPTVATYFVGNNPRDVAVGDMEGDGDLDLVVSTGGENVAVMLNDGSGNFSSFFSVASGLTGCCLSAIAFDDLNGDGLPDVVVTNGNTDQLAVLLNLGAGNLDAPIVHNVGNFPGNVAAVDIDGDNDLDLALSNRNFPYQLQIMTNDGNGNFDAPVNFATGVGPAGLAVADLNYDGTRDVAVALSGPNEVAVLLNQTFQDCDGDGIDDRTLPVFSPQPRFEISGTSDEVGWPWSISNTSGFDAEVLDDNRPCVTFGGGPAAFALAYVQTIKDPRRNNLTVFLVVILSAAKDLPCNYREILRCAQNDSRAK